MKLNNMNVQNFIKSDMVTRKQFLFLSLLTITVEGTWLTWQISIVKRIYNLAFIY